jgi:hypothetical protein
MPGQMTAARRSQRIPLAAGLMLLAACDHFASAGEAAPSPNLTPVPPATAQRDVCAAPVPDHPISVALVRRSDGSCVPFDRSFLFRCDPSMPAVAVVDNGQGIRRFLGGAYAVRVAAVPSTALAVGVTPFGAVFEDGANQAFVWVQRDGVTERWLAIPNRNKLSDPPTVQMIGDSILDGGQIEVAAGLPAWTVSIDAEVGRGSVGATIVAESLASPAADAVVIEIGVNDADASSTVAGAERIVAAQGDARLLVWLTAHGPEIGIPAVNEAIVAAMGQVPNGAVLDWDRLVPLDALSSDGVHPDVGQQGVLATILDPFLQTWLDAVNGAGPTACESAIRAAA